MEQEFKEESYSLEAERGLLGAWLLQGSELKVMDKTADIKADDFFVMEHEKIAQCIRELEKQHKAIDVITVSAQLRTHMTGVQEREGGRVRDWLDMVGGVPYLEELRNSVLSTTFHYEDWTDILKDCRRKRDVGEIARQAHYASLNPAMTAETCENILAEGLAQKRHERKDKTFMEIAQEAVEKMVKGKEVIQHGWPRPYLGSLDEYLEAFPPQNVGILGGLPGTGKSSLGGYFCLKNAQRGIPVTYVSLEMDYLDVFNRMVACEAGLENRAIRNQNLLPDEVNFYLQKANEMAELPITIIDGCEQIDEAVYSAIRRSVVQSDTRFVVIDYLQLMYSKRTAGSRNDELAHITATLKAMAKALNVYILEVSQFSRDNAKDERKPKMQDLRDSGSLEQNADDVLLLSEMKEGATNDSATVLIDLAKHRGGKKGVATVTFNKRYQQWTP